MTDEEIRLRCIEMAATLYRDEASSIFGEFYPHTKRLVEIGDMIFQEVYPYLKKNKIPSKD